MTWRLVITPRVQTTPRTFPPQTKRYVRQTFLELRHDPRSGQPLRDELAGLHSFRVKRFRIVYRIQPREATVVVVAVGRRDTVYDALAAEVRSPGGRHAGNPPSVL